MNSWILFGLCAVGALLAFWTVMKPFIDDNRVRGKVLNFDEGMKSYFFRLDTEASALRSSLEAGAEALPLEYEFRPEEDRILFRKDKVEAAYRLHFCEKEGWRCLRVTREAAEREPGLIPYLVNAFFIKGFGLRPIDYRQFQELFAEGESK